MHLRAPFVLASASPRRKHLLSLAGIPFAVVPSDIEETVPEGAPPEAVVQSLAQQKASHVASLPQHRDALVLGADTIVVHEGQILGKPDSADHARAMLRRLSGARHTVYTGVALVHRSTSRTALAAEATAVYFGALTEGEIDRYVAGGSPMDKAGAYGIQDDAGAFFVRRIEGDYYNVVGLPLYRLGALLRAEFSDLLAHHPAE
jgi:septum formation protein